MNWLLDLLDAIPALWRLVEIKTEAMFLRQLRAYCLQLFRGELGEFAWIQDMTDTIADQMGKAWREGARAVGVEPSEFTNEDIEELNKIIASEYDYVLALGSDILALRLMGGTLEEYRTKFAGRIEVWAHRYTDVVNQAKVWFGKRKKVKLKWEMGATEEHCATCAALNGIVAYAEDWERSGIHPQNPPNQALECGGWRCDCALVPTTERATNNAFDEIVDRVTAAKDGEKSLKANTEGGHWVTINGDHVFIDENGVPQNAPYLGKDKKPEESIEAAKEKIYNAEKETGYIFDKDGNVIGIISGDEIHVEFSKENLDKLQDSIILHNHPGIENNFSNQDVFSAELNDVSETIVVSSTKDGAMVEYSLKRPPGGWPSISHALSLTKDDGPIMGKYKKYRLLGLSLDDAHHKALTDYAKEIGATYSRKYK